MQPAIEAGKSKQIQIDSATKEIDGFNPDPPQKNPQKSQKHSLEHTKPQKTVQM